MIPERERSSGILLEGKYRLLDELGRGGMGTVFRAYDESLDRYVAVKFLLPELQIDKTLVDRFRREARAMASVRHENVLNIFSFGTHGLSSFFVMEFIEGQAAEQMLESAQEREAFLPIEEVVRILDQAAAGLSAVHRAGVVHRDIKPGNIMVEAETKRAVIMDFGIGKRYEAKDQRRTQSPSGTPAYMAPEVVSGQEISSNEDYLSDIYAFGVTAFELLTCRLPFEGESWVDLCVKHVTQPPPTPSTLRPNLPGELDELVLKCLAKIPLERVQSCDEIREALAPFLQSSVVPGTVRVPTPIPSSLESGDGAHRAEPKKLDTTISGAVRIVVADPESAFRNLVYQCAEDVFPGCRFLAARSNTQGLKLATVSPPLLFIASLDDREFNGLELAATLSGHTDLQNVQLILTYDRITAGERRLLEGMGVGKLLLRPVERPPLQDIFAALVKQVREKRSKRRVRR